MTSVTSAGFQRGFGRYREVAQREPVVITSDSRESLVLLSAEEYRRLKRLDREPLHPLALREVDLPARREARAPDAAAAFDTERTG